jgi:hypothetical protein
MSFERILKMPPERLGRRMCISQNGSFLRDKTIAELAEALTVFLEVSRPSRVV